jgi:hypothetical protein
MEGSRREEGQEGDAQHGGKGGTVRGVLNGMEGRMREGKGVGENGREGSGGEGEGESQDGGGDRAVHGVRKEKKREAGEGEGKRREWKGRKEKGVGEKERTMPRVVCIPRP